MFKKKSFSKPFGEDSLQLKSFCGLVRKVFELKQGILQFADIKYLPDEKKDH